MTTDKPRIPYTKPSITDLEVSYATDAAANGWGERSRPSSANLLTTACRTHQQ